MIDHHVTENDRIGAPHRKRPVLEIDFEKYLNHMRASDATEEQKRALIVSLCQIMSTFVDMGFDLCPIQHLPLDRVSCEQKHETAPLETDSLTDVIESIVSQDTDLTTAFDETAKA